MVDSWGATVVGGAGAIVGLVLAGRMLPLPSLDGEHGALGFGAWLAAAIVSAALVRVMLSRVPPGPLGAAAGWVAGTLVAAAVVGSQYPVELSPSRMRFEQTGPVLALWLAAGCVGSTVRAAHGRELGAGSVPLRVVFTWAASYAAVWVLVALMFAPMTRSLPSPVRVAVGVLGLAGAIVAFAVSSAWVGPSEPRAQAGAALLAQPLVVLTGPGASAWLASAWRRGWPNDPLVPMLVIGGVLSMLSVVASACATALVVQRARRAVRDGAASGSPAR